MSNLAVIESLTREYSAAWGKLKGTIEFIDRQRKAVEARYSTQLASVLDKVKAHKDELECAIYAAPELFNSPRTIVVAGVKVGFQKSKGSLRIDNPETTIKLIRKHLSDSVDEFLLIKTNETPIASALMRLSAAELKKIGCEIVGTGDEIVIKTTDTEIEKLVKAMIKEGAGAGV